MENEKMISEDSDVAQSLNYFFLSIVTNIKIPEYTDIYSNSGNITYPIIKIFLKYRNHPSILTIGEVCKERSTSPVRYLEFRHAKIPMLPQEVSKKMQLYFQNFCIQA